MISKAQTLELSQRHLIPGRIHTFGRAGIDLVIGRREMYKIWDLDGREFFDLHLNGGTYNLGHRAPELVATLRGALDEFDMGNHHFPSPARATFAEKLFEVSPQQSLPFTVFTSGGGEAVDVAIRSARWATGRRRIVTIDSGFHGRTGLSGAAGDRNNADYFHSALPDDFLQVPWGDVAALEAAFASDAIAAVLLETIPATMGFPTVPQGYHDAVRQLCDTHGALFIADEVQTGLGRTGEIWAVDSFGVVPDMLVTGKGLGGGLYPVSAVVLSERAGGWLAENGWGHVSTTGGSELGAVVGLAALQRSTAPETLAHVRVLSEHFAAGLAALQLAHPSLDQVHQRGLVIGLRFAGLDGAIRAMSTLYRHGIWAIFAGFDSSMLQFKPGLLLSLQDADEVLARMALACAELDAAL
ncbi:aminotransferase class III-fold pyridoxal phosphate-dependent enzyme [Leucobacter albus]|uniref:Aminotransferase class III-fold pyridoxal phosphate-dependent enzyme n=1 Tax=Leucobacter albus TaxID=272210 RepID=A0ABW3TS05_9MICO